MKKFLTALFCVLGLFASGFTEEKSSEKDFVIQLTQNFPQLHPQLVYESTNMQLATATSEGLFTYDPYSALPVKALVKSYKVTGNTWRFELRDDATFENGDPVTAETIKQSWMNLLTPGADFPYASLLDCIQGVKDYRTGKNKSESSVAINAESKYTLSVYLSEATPHLPSILCNAAFAAVHPSQLQYAVQYQRKPFTVNEKNAFIPISNGPYKITQYDGKKIVFEKNKNYWDAASVSLEKIIVRLDLSDKEQAEAFNTGALQWTKDAKISEIVGSQVISYAPMFGTSFFFFNAHDKNIADKKVRQALLYAIPYEKLREGYHLAAESFVFPLADYPTVKKINDYNPSQAKKLFNELKLTDKQKQITIKIYDYEYLKNQAQILKDAWEEVGFSVTIKIMPPTADLQMSLRENDYSISSINWIADFADPIAMLELFRGTSTLNFSNWIDKNFDALLNAASNENNLHERYKKLAEAEEYLLKNYMVIPLAFSLSLNIIDSSEIEGWYPNALDVHPFKFIKYKKKTLAPGFI